ncbi:MAG: tRNA (adenine-N1)-methyltransferase [Acidimicrobiia bacterium]
MSDLFAAGDLCLLLDARGRRYLIDLVEDGQFQYHAGTLQHREVIGLPPGSLLRSTSDARLIALRPRLADYVLKMPRGAQLIYPKDLGPMVLWGDVATGQTVIEAGTGSGALTLALLRAVGPTGTVLSVERRQDHFDHAAKTISRFHGKLPSNLELMMGDVHDVVVDRPGADRLMLDLPEPWSVIEAAAGSLAAGAVLCAYVPTVPQVQRLTDALRRTGWFVDPETFEGLHREWKIEGRSVRPKSQMVGHTGFITVARHTAASVKPDDPTAGEE